MSGSNDGEDLFNVIDQSLSSEEPLREGVTMRVAEEYLKGQGFVSQAGGRFWRRSADREYRQIVPYRKPAAGPVKVFAQGAD